MCKDGERENRCVRMEKEREEEVYKDGERENRCVRMEKEREEEVCKDGEREEVCKDGSLPSNRPCRVLSSSSLSTRLSTICSRPELSERELGNLNVRVFTFSKVKIL